VAASLITDVSLMPIPEKCYYQNFPMIEEK